MDSGLEQELRDIFYYSTRILPLRQEGLRFRISVLRLSIALLLTSIFCYGVFYIMYYGYYFPVYGLVLFCYDVQTITMAVIVPLYVLWSTLRVGRLNEVVLALEAWDRRLLALQLRPDYAVPTRWLKVHFILYFIALVPDFIYCIFDVIWSLNEVLVYFSSFLFKVFAVYESASLIRMCSKRFKLMNDSLTSGEFKYQSSKIVKLVSDHQCLCSISEKVNTLVSPLILAIISDVFSTVTFDLYYVEYFSESDRMDLVFSMAYDCVIWALLYLTYTGDLLSASTETVNEANKFNVSLYKLMLHDRTKVLLSNDKLHLHILMKKKLNFTVCGLFNLDYTLVLMIISAVMTYIFILIQFGMTRYNSTPSSATNLSSIMNHTHNYEV